MKPNIGKVDRLIRILIGLGLIAYGLINKNWIGALGLVPLLTALIRWCPMYCPLRLSTCSKGEGSCGCGSGGCGKS